MKVCFYWITLICLLSSCSGDQNQSNLVSLSLLKKGGIPITILAPDSTTIQTMDLIVQKDVSIKGPNNYYVQIFSSDATSTDVAKLKASMKAEVTKQPYFHEIIKEEAAGFIFENKLDSLTSSYDFRYALIKGNSEYRFQAGLIGSFTIEEVELMYKAVQQ